jgi:hypothetical protein
MKNNWKHGQKTELAKKAGITKAHLGDILHRRARASAALSLKLEDCCEKLGIKIKKEDFVWSKETTNIYFT